MANDTNISSYALDGRTAGERHGPANNNAAPGSFRAIANDAGLTFLDNSAHGLAFPQRGDVVRLGNLVGICENSVAALTEHVQVTKFGRYVLTVNGADAAGAATAVNVGDQIFYDAAVPELNLDGTNGVPFGVAVGPGDGELIAAAAGPNTGTLIVDVGYF